MQPRTQDSNKPLTGLDKAAIMMLSFDESSASEVLKLMEEREIQRITGHASRLRKINMEQINSVREEFLVRLSDSSPLLISQAREQLKVILKKILPPERYEKFIEIVETGDELSEGFDSIKWIDSQSIASFLSHEHPQTIALVLAHLETDKAAEVLMGMPKPLQSDIILRIANLDRINPELVKEVQEVMITEIMASGASKSRRVGGSHAVAEILNNLDGQTEEAIFNAMEETDSEMAETIRELMFVFEDLVKIDDRGLQLVMKEVTNDVLTLALKTAPEELRAKIFKNISSRAAEMIKEDLATMGPAKLSDVEKAQQEIVKICRRLEAEGKLMLAGGGGEVFV
ncbi:MAG: flagellar motor switch protein FliG [Candidatus Sumerlaeia bacterium]